MLRGGARSRRTVAVPVPHGYRRCRMPGARAPRAGGPAANLEELLRAIAGRDRSRVTALLSKAPELARQALTAGATREDPHSHYYEAINHYAYQGDTALHLAAAAHEDQMVGQLLLHGASPSARNRRGAQPLHYASDGVPGSKAWQPLAQAETVVRLLAAGADPDALDKSGVAPLHRAVRTRSTGAVRALLAGGARVGLLNASGSTPLHLAVQDTGRGGSG